MTPAQFFIVCALAVAIALCGQILTIVIGVKVMADLSKLQAKVAANGDVIQSSITLIQGISQALKNANGDQDAIDALTAQLDAQESSLAAAVAANTPAAPAAPAAPVATDPNPSPTT